MFSKTPPSHDNPPQPRRACWGLVTRRERWGLSLRGWTTLILLLICSAVFVLFGVHPFLAVTASVPADCLVVEGWIHEYAIPGTVAEFRAGQYKKLFTTGGPVNSMSGSHIGIDDTYAYIAAQIFRKQGLTSEEVEMVPTFKVDRDRTYASALVLRDHFREKGFSPQSLNVVTLGVHARRTRLLYEKAFGNEVKIGIIAMPNLEYDTRHWWKYSEGVKEVFSESLGYVYARFIF
jgi:hypothetical protein